MVVTRASRPCESCNRHTGETPVPLPSENQMDGDDEPLRQRRQWTLRVARARLRRHHEHTRGVEADERHCREIQVSKVGTALVPICRIAFPASSRFLVAWK